MSPQATGAALGGPEKRRLITGPRRAGRPAVFSFTAAGREHATDNRNVRADFVAAVLGERFMPEEEVEHLASAAALSKRLADGVLLRGESAAPRRSRRTPRYRRGTRPSNSWCVMSSAPADARG